MRYLAKQVPYKLGEAVRLVFFSDTHIGSPGFAKNHFKKFLQSSMDHPNAYLMGIGDLLDCIVPSDIKRFQISCIDPKYLASEHADEVLDMQKAEAVELLMPYRERLLGLVLGNHCYQISKRYGTNIHRQVCNELGADNLGYSCLYRLNLRENGGRGRSYVIHATHGFGAGTVSEGYSITKYSRLIYSYDADCYISAHDHQLWSKRLSRIGVTSTGKMEDRTILLCNTGAFCKTLSDTDSPSYSEVKGYPPRVLGGIVIDLYVDSHRWIEVRLID